MSNSNLNIPAASSAPRDDVVAPTRPPASSPPDENILPDLTAIGIVNDGHSRDVEDDPDDPDDIADARQAPIEDNASASLNTRPPPRHVMVGFEAHMDAVRKSVTGQGSSRRVTIYDKMGSFQMPYTDPFFLLQRDTILPSTLLTPRYFYWDPLVLIEKGTPVKCHGPKCKGKGGNLIRHSFGTRPRRVVDLEDCYWLMGARYQCNECNATMPSWDPLVLKALSPVLASQFPAHCSWRSGISTRLFAFMRRCFHNGMGASQFADSVRVMHRRRHEQLEVAYLQTIIARANNGRRDVYEPFPSFNDSEFQAALPSGGWFRDMYDNFIEKHEPEFNQHTALLSCEVDAIDHSYKVGTVLHDDIHA